MGSLVTTLYVFDIRGFRPFFSAKLQRVKFYETLEKITLFYTKILLVKWPESNKNVMSKSALSNLTKYKKIQNRFRCKVCSLFVAMRIIWRLVVIYIPTIMFRFFQTIWKCFFPKLFFFFCVPGNHFTGRQKSTFEIRFVQNENWFCKNVFFSFNVISQMCFLGLSCTINVF